MPREFQYGPFRTVADAIAAERGVKAHLARAKDRKRRGDPEGAADVAGWSEELAHVQQEKARLKRAADL